VKLLLTFLLAASLPAQTISQLLATMSATAQYRETAVSPDGRWLAWAVGVPDSEVWLLDLSKPGAAARRLGRGSDIAFSPDSKEIAYLSDGARKEQTELFTQALGGGGPHKLTNLTGYLAAPRWSPDGKKIALLFTENAPRKAGPLEPATRDTGVVEQHIFEQRLTLIDPHSGAAKPITPEDTYVYEYDWAPDSERIAYTASKGNGDNNWWVAQLFRLAVSTGQVSPVHKPEAQIANPRWSPDGKQIAYIGGIMSDEGVTGGDIYSVPSEGGAATDLTPKRHGSPSWLQWLPSGRIIFTETVDGATGLDLLNPMGLGVETLWRRDESIGGIAVSGDGSVTSMIRSSWTLAPEVWAGPRGDDKVRTHANDSLKPLWGKPESIHWQSDGEQVQGWLLYPANYDPGRKYPMVVSVHGGPASAKRQAWPVGHFDMSVMSSQGYFVLFPNPRGSYGAGETFAHANVKDFGYGDLKDVISGVDWAVASRPIDGNRVGIAGWSYGGYMTMWTVTQTHRFRAAVAGAGIADWQSYYGENLIDQWMIPYFGASVYDDPAVYARSSPITYIGNVRTPTLILVGDGDAECPAPQSYEFWHALKTLGVSTELVIYPGEATRSGSPNT